MRVSVTVEAAVNRLFCSCFNTKRKFPAKLSTNVLTETQSTTPSQEVTTDEEIELAGRILQP